MPEPELRILHVRSSGGYYGAEAVIETLARGQAAAGNYVHVACLDDRRESHTELLERLADTAIQTLGIPSAGRIDLRVPWRIAEAVKYRQIELLHVHDYKTLLLGLPASWLARVPLVTTFHGEVADDRAVSTYEGMARFALRFAGGVAVVSRSQERQLGDLGLAPVFIPNAVDVDSIGAAIRAARDAGTTLRAPLGIPASAVVVGTIGRLCRDKGQLDALAAVERVLSMNGQLHWVLAGGGEDEDELRSRIAASPVGERIHLAGYVTDRGALYGALDILLHPSHREGLSMVVLEAMAARLTVLATPVGEVGALVDDCGVVLTDRDQAVVDALTAVLNAPEQARDMADRGARRVTARYSAAAMSRRYTQELYHPALGGSLL